MMLFLCFIFSLVLSFSIERLTTPSLTENNAIRIVLKIAIISLIFNIIFFSLKRPLFTVSLTFLLEFLLIIISNTKYKTLHEPLVFTDIILYAQVFQFPRMYLPFLGRYSFLGIVIGILFLVLFFLFEPARLLNMNLLLLHASFIVLLIYLIFSFVRKIEVTINPSLDIKKYDLLSLIVLYFIKNLRENKDPIFPLNDLLENEISHPIVCVQSESFFDARKLSPLIKGSVLHHYDNICNQSLMRGNLEVPAWGANTMRTEFSFLTGLSNEMLGYKKFYPHFFYKNKKIPSIISVLKNKGYKTICIHPYPANFFQRKTLFYNLGFDEFIDIKMFSNNEKFGPYISDKAITDKIKQLLVQHKNENIFIFAITMENHGPLSLEKVKVTEKNTFFKENIDDSNELDELIVYLKHLKNADKMIKELGDVFNKSKGLFCFYGDHLPNMANIFKKYDYKENDTQYFFGSSSEYKSCYQDVKIERLAPLILKFLR